MPLCVPCLHSASQAVQEQPMETVCMKSRYEQERGLKAAAAAAAEHLFILFCL